MSGKEAQAELDLDLGEEDGPDVEVTVEQPAENAENAVETEATTSEQLR